MSTRAAIYKRQSLDTTGEGHGVARQREDGFHLAQRRSWEVAAEFEDNDVSAAGKKRRPGFEQLLAAIDDGAVDVVIAWSLDRLTRNRPDTVRLIEACQKRGVTIALVRGSDIDMSTPAGRLTADILASVARHEIEQKADRQRRAAQQRAEQGKPPMGTRLTGYTPAGELVAHEAEIVDKLFTRFAAGDSLRSLAAWLTDSHIPTRRGGPHWNPSTIRDILTNPRYAGRAVYDGRETGKPGAWTAIVDDGTFTVVQTQLADPRRKTQVGTDRKHLGSGLYECCVCGGKVTSWSGQRYRCRNSCVNRVRTHIDDLVTAYIRERLSREDVADLLVGEGSQETRAIGEQIKTLHLRLRQIADDYDADLIDGQRYAVKSARVRAELSAAEAAIARLGVGAGVAAVLRAPDPVAAFDHAPLMIKRSVVDWLVTVRLHPTRRGWKRFDPTTVDITPKR